MGENPLNQSGSDPLLDYDIVSTSNINIILEQFIRERYRREIVYREIYASTLYMKKSLGEMESKDLGISTVIPGYGRTLKQFTINDYKSLLKEITTLQDDKTVFTKGIKVRKEDII